LREGAIARVDRDALRDDALEFARFEAARLPIFAFVRPHGRNGELVIDDACKRVSEERQLRRALRARERGEQCARVPRRQQHAEGRALRHRAAGGEFRSPAGQHRHDRTGRQRDQFVGLHFAHDPAVRERRLCLIEIDAALRVAVR
jgi:hypothetical protein